MAMEKKLKLILAWIAVDVRGAREWRRDRTEDGEEHEEEEEP